MRGDISSPDEVLRHMGRLLWPRRVSGWKRVATDGVERRCDAPAKPWTGFDITAWTLLQCEISSVVVQR